MGSKSYAKFILDDTDVLFEKIINNHKKKTNIEEDIGIIIDKLPKNKIKKITESILFALPTVKKIINKLKTDRDGTSPDEVPYSDEYEGELDKKLIKSIIKATKKN